LEEGLRRALGYSGTLRFSGRREPDTLVLGPDRLDRYSLEQVTPGIWFLIGESSPSQSTQPLLKSNVRLQQRIGCVDEMTDFFRVFVAPAARGGAMSRRILSHRLLHVAKTGRVFEHEATCFRKDAGLALEADRKGWGGTLLLPSLETTDLIR